MKLKLLILFLICASRVLDAQTIDTKDSNVSFTIQNMKIRTVEGTFTGMQGNIRFDKSDLSNSSFEVCIDTKTVNTENKKRDEHLKKEDFFYVEKYPTICFSSKSIKKSESKYLLNGNLTMLGVTRAVSIPISLGNNMISGVFTINRNDYNLGPDGGFMVGKEVQITINCKLL